MQPKPLVNKQIRAKEVRLIDETGKQVGVVTLENALQMAQNSGLDLIQVTERVEPPVCKIMNYGKYIYQLGKKEKQERPKGGELKGIRLSLGISQHDMEVRTRQAAKFLKDGNKVRIEMRLKGREKAMGDFAKEKIYKFLETLKTVIPNKVERDLKRDPRGFSMIISKG
ncbi:MAG: translation initiation factor IF-3 [Candidatus Nealsonbacteria bacterium]|nr:translation initiation factor IF-3 [Candidatus Nealsonbacteria bacterium]